MDELIHAQLNDKFCFDICRSLNYEEVCALELEPNGLLVQTATPDR